MSDRTERRTRRIQGYSPSATALELGIGGVEGCSTSCTNASPSALTDLEKLELAMTEGCAFRRGRHSCKEVGITSAFVHSLARVMTIILSRPSGLGALLAEDLVVRAIRQQVAPPRFCSKL